MPTLLVRDLPIIMICDKCDAKLKRLPKPEWARVFRLIEQQGGYCHDFFRCLVLDLSRRPTIQGYPTSLTD